MTKVMLALHTVTHIQETKNMQHVTPIEYETKVLQESTN